jgi:rhodanese-related sulfurtransferase
LLGNLARRAPVVVVFDDAHEADASSWEALAYLVRCLPSARVLFVATARPAELADSPVATDALLALEQEDCLRRLPVEPLQLVDGRTPKETAQGTLLGAREIPLAIITKLPDALDRSAPVLVCSAGGYRSLVRASVLWAAGFGDVADLLGGYRAWEDAGLRVVREAAPEAAAAPEVSAGMATALVEISIGSGRGRTPG